MTKKNRYASSYDDDFGSENFEAFNHKSSSKQQEYSKKRKNKYQSARRARERERRGY